MIQGVSIKNLKIHPDERGRLMEVLRKDDSIFKKFGQVYITTVNPGFVKGWHYHKLQYDSFCCLKGKIRLVLYDSRESSETKGEVNEFLLSLEEQKLVQIPPQVMHGIESMSNEESIILNITSETYNREIPDEFRVDPFNNDIPFKWKNTKGH